MPGRKKRDAAPGSGETLPGIVNPLSTPTPVVAVVEPAPAVVAVEVLSVEPAGDGAAAEPRKLNGRKSRSRKQPLLESSPLPEEPKLPADVPVPIAEAAIPSPVSLSPLPDATEPLRQVMDRFKEVQEQLGALRQGLQDVSREVDEIRQRSASAKKDLNGAGESLGQFAAVRQELQDVTRELGAIRSQSASVKQELLEAKQSVGELGAIRQALQDVTGDVDAIRAHSQSVKQELLETKQSVGELGAIRQGLQDVTGDVDALRAHSQSVKQELLETKQSVDQLEALRQGLQDVTGEVGAIRDHSQSVKQELLEAGNSLGQFRQGLQDGARDMDDLRQRSATVKQTLVDTGEATGQLQQIRKMREELQGAEGEAAEVKEWSLAVKKELQETQDVMATLRHALETTREDLKSHMREAAARFFAIGESCQDLKRDIVEAQQQIATLRPQPVTVSVSTAAAPEATAPVKIEHSVNQGVIVDEHGSPIESKSSVPAMEAAAPAAPAEGKKVLGVTVGPDAVVVEVLADTPAEKAGLRLGDVVVSVDGKPITNSEDLRQAIEHVDNDREVHVTVTRDGETQTLSVHLAEPLDLLVGSH